jgi:GT2 family glycosyltransferase
VTAARLAAVVLNFRTPALTAASVRALQASTRRVDDLLVVDNGSGDGSEAALRGAVPDVTILQTGANLGFSGGCNAGIRHVLDRGADLVLLANSDLEVSPGCLGTLEAALAAQPGLGVVGPALVSSAGPPVVESLGIRFSRVTGRLRHRSFGRPPGPVRAGAGGIRPVDAVSGCAMLVKREVFERIGELAEEYFFGFEDVDFCVRARRAGFRTGCVEGAVARHRGAGTIGRRSPRRLYFAARNHLLLARRAAPLPGPLSALRGAWIVGLNLAHALFVAEVPAHAGVRAVAAGVRDYLRGRFGDSPGGDDRALPATGPP